MEIAAPGLRAALSGGQAVVFVPMQGDDAYIDLPAGIGAIELFATYSLEFLSGRAAYYAGYFNGTFYVASPDVATYATQGPFGSREYGTDIGPAAAYTVGILYLTYNSYPSHTWTLEYTPATNRLSFIKLDNAATFVTPRIETIRVLGAV